MNKKAIEKINLLCGEEVKFISAEQNLITILLPYSDAEVEIEIEGSTIEERVDSFITGVNHELEQMINHLEDCKLNMNIE